MEAAFIVDHNAGKIAKWLRMLGYDTLFFTGEDDFTMVSIAMRENRIILTRDTGVMKRRQISSGRVKAILLASDNSQLQIQQVLRTLKINNSFALFTRCLECNKLLVERTKEEVEGRVPPYVYSTQEHYVECTFCKRIYWKGTHWQAMIDKISRFTES